MVKILHFADAHIDMANYGRHDPQSGLPLRVMDFLKSLDTIMDAAIQERVDLVIFAGDAYRDRNPAPTFQREWGRRIMRLSRAGIPVILLVGNHDLSPALGRAHAIEEFATLEVPLVRVIEKPTFLGPGDLNELPLQVMALPWITRSGLLAKTEMSATETKEVYKKLEEHLTELVNTWFDQVDPTLPVVLTAHASVEGAVYGGERTIMLGNDLVLSGSLVRDPRLDYTALGHIHKPQNLNENAHPPVIYPGSIERVDFGEIEDQRYYVIADVQRGHTQVDWRALTGIRSFVDRRLELKTSEDITRQLRAALPPPNQLEGAIVRLIVEYPQEWEAMIDEAALREHAASAFEFRLVRQRQAEMRVRIPGDKNVGSLTPLELLDLYWDASHVDDQAKVHALDQLAKQIIEDTN